jgi:AcrR family transcriptional regulator
MMFMPRRNPPARRDSRRARQRAEMRERICAAAMELFLREGFERTTIRRIADAVEYAPGAIYSWFRDKDDIFYELHARAFQKFRAFVRPEIEQAPTPAERLRRAGELYLRFAFEHPQHYELMFIMSVTGRRIQEQDPRWEEGLENYDFLRGIVRDCIEDGSLPRGDLEAATFAIWSAVHGIASLVIRGRCPMIPDDALPRVVTDAYEYTLRTLLREPSEERLRPRRAARSSRSS